MENELHAPAPGIVVMKFGGTSLETPARIRDVVALVAERAATRCTVVVVSALARVTNDLLEAARLATAGDPGGEALLNALCERHLAAVDALAPATEQEALTAVLQSWTKDLRSLLHGISLVRDCSPRVLDALVAYGELFSSAVVAAALRAANVPAIAVDARTMIVTDDTF